MKPAIICLLFLLRLPAFSQDASLDTMVKKFTAYTSATPQEKLFVHTDKSFYTAGEIIWFKIYDMDATTHKPLDLSKVSYVEVFNKENKAVMQAKISMKSGSGHGSFLLPFSINTGHYTLRAYTNWMKNFSSDLFFETQITIVNTLKKPDWQTASDSLRYSVQFFPEGGNLVNGLPGKIAFKGTDQYGRSFNFSGFLLNSKSDTLVRFQPLKFGMGSFAFSPSASEKYQVIIRTGNRVVELPFLPVANEGYVMNVTDNHDQNLIVSVQTNQPTADPFVYLMIHSQDSVDALQKVQLQNGKATATFSKSSMKEGISRLALFNGNRQPLCERLVCKPPKQKLSVEVKPTELQYGTRKKVELQISTGELGTQTSSNLSLSVYRLDSLTSAKQDDIVSYVWLSSDIKGKIESPEYYLKDTSAETLTALDNLMLTQGWRRITPEASARSRQAFQFLPEYEGQMITAKITTASSQTPIPNAGIYLSAPGNHFEFSHANSDENGMIRFTAPHFYGTSEMLIQAGPGTENNYQVSVINPFSETSASSPISPLQLPDQWANQLTENSINTQTQNAYFSDERQHFTLSNATDTGLFYGLPDKRYVLDNYTRFPTMEEVMREFVTEVRLSKQQNQYRYAVSNNLYQSFFKDEPLVLLDGIPVWNTNQIIAFNPLLVKQLDVVTHKYFLGNQTYNGIVSYTTYKGDGGNIELNPNAVQLEYEGLQLDREFYSPSYETLPEQESRTPDFRNLLYWSPDIFTNNAGLQTVSFYTSDVAGRYAVVVQGNSASGAAGCQTVFISVKN